MVYTHRMDSAHDVALYQGGR